MKIKNIFFLIMALISLSSCTNDSISDLEQPNDNDNITYLTKVKQIIDNNCINCHGTTPTNGAPMSLTTYENVKDAVLTRNLLDRISRAEGVLGAMPLGGPRLPQNDIDAISEWIDLNFPQ